MKTFKKYIIFIIAAILIGVLFLINKDMGFKAVSTIKSSSKEMILILPPIFILLGLMDVWVPRDTMVKFMGEGSGIIGGILSFIIGSAAAGPLYVVFPVAIAFMKKGVKFSNILILIGAWSTTKIPMLLFESTSLGLNFMLTRLAVNIPIILIMTFVMTKILKDDEIAAIYEGAKEQEG